MSQADQEATAQATTGQEDRLRAADPNTANTVSNATAEWIKQIQISGCKGHCHGVRQVQTAAQANTTVQVVKGATPVDTHPDPQAQQPDTSSAVKTHQIRVGCVSHCYGRTSTTSPATLAADIRILQELLDEITTGSPNLNPTPSAEQNTVQQISYQWQHGDGAGVVQTQSASQSSTSMQVADLAASVTSALQTVSALPRATAGTAVNQTEQGIWQLQVGCLVGCEETQQYQQAEQSNLSSQTVVAISTSSPGTTASAIDVTTQVIWQVQIGCLDWCYDATQQQIATSRNTVVMVGSNGTTMTSSIQASSSAAITHPQETPLASGVDSSKTARGDLASGGPQGGTATSSTPVNHLIRPAAAPIVSSPEVPRAHRAAVSSSQGGSAGASASWPARQEMPPTSTPFAASVSLGARQAAGSNLRVIALLAAVALCTLCLSSAAVARRAKDCLLAARPDRAPGRRLTKTTSESKVKEMRG